MNDMKNTKAGLLRELASLRRKLHKYENATRPKKAPKLNSAIEGSGTHDDVAAAEVEERQEAEEIIREGEMLLRQLFSLSPIEAYSEIAERKRTEETSRDSEWKYHLLADNIRDVVWAMNLEGRFIYVSPSVTAQTGFSPEAYYMKSLAEILSLESAARLTKLLSDELSKQPDQRIESIIIELQLNTKAGPPIDTEIHASWIYSEDGTPVGVVGVTRDISIRKRAEQALRESEERFRALASFASEGVLIHDNGAIIDANQAMADIVGAPNPELLIGKNGMDFIGFTPESKQILMDHTTSSSEKSYNAEIVRPDGSHIRLLAHGRDSILRGRPIRIVTMLNVTDRYEAEQALRESEAKFRTVGTSAPDALILINDEGRVEYLNPAAERMFGYTVSEMQGVDVHSKIMPDQYSMRLKKAFQKFQETGTGDAIGRIVELVAKKKNGAEFPIEITVNPILLKGKYWASAIIRDITERKLAEEERTLNSMRLAALLELNQMTSASLQDLTHFAMEEAVRLTGSKIGYIAFTNEDETALTMYTWSKAAMAQCLIENKPLVYPIETTGLWGEAVRQRRPVVTNDYAADNPLKHGFPEGHVRITRHMNVPIFDGKRIVVVAGVGNKPEDYNESDVRQLTLLMEGMWRIITRRMVEEERSSLQEQLVQASKMEAVGRLAGGVAHDFNNLLTTILGYSESILHQLKTEDPLQAEVAEIQKAGERAASLTQQLLAFSRKQIIKPQVIDLNATVKEARKMLERLIGENIKLVFNLASDLGSVNADSHQIDQVLLNLAVNARDAMPDGGVLTVSTANLTLNKENALTHSEIVPGEYVTLSVSDTGEGMNDETKSRLFEPFFSTKGKGKGTGLGLATVYGIAKQSGGAIEVISESGCGAVFHFYLPRTYGTPAAKEVPRRTSSPTGSETVLLVEDEILVRQFTRRVLSRLGYVVLEAESIEDAIRICEVHSMPIHLLLTDVVMPDMNGVELYSRLRANRSDLKALFMSGYAEDAITRHGVLAEGTGFIQKPFKMEILANRIRQTLDSSGSAPES